MPAELIKLPKWYRQPQRWRAECYDEACISRCAGFTTYWAGRSWRAAAPARRDRDEHNAAKHP